MKDFFSTKMADVTIGQVAKGYGLLCVIGIAVAAVPVVAIAIGDTVKDAAYKFKYHGQEVYEED